MIRQCNELSPQYQHTTIQPSARTTDPQQNKRSSTATDEYDFEMELDEQLGVEHVNSSWNNKDQYEEDPLGNEDDARSKEAQYQQLTDDTLQYGRELQREFATDQRREIKRALEDTFALIGYANPRESSLAPLLEVTGRVPVAEELNSAILGTLFSYKSTCIHHPLTLNSFPRQVLLGGPRAPPPANRSPCRLPRRRWRLRRLSQRPPRLFNVVCSTVTVCGAAWAPEMVHPGCPHAVRCVTGAVLVGVAVSRLGYRERRLGGSRIRGVGRRAPVHWGCGVSFWGGWGGGTCVSKGRERCVCCGYMWMRLVR